VITDFDATVTKHHVNGTRCLSSSGVLNRSPLLPPDNKAAFIRLFEKYYPIEICLEMSEEEKFGHMVDWYKQARANMMSCGIKEDMIKKSIELSTIQLRDNVQDTFRMLHRHQIPVLVFSAGIGNVIEELLRKYGILYPNVEIISNFMEFNAKDGALLGYKDLMVHPLNKNEAVLGDENKYFMDLSHRDNAILMGDHTSDVQMSRGMPHTDSILKIGFLNDKISERLSRFMDVFDIVLIDDQSMDFVNQLLRVLLSEHK